MLTRVSKTKRKKKTDQTNCTQNPPGEQGIKSKYSNLSTRYNTENKKRFEF